MVRTVLNVCGEHGLAWCHINCGVVGFSPMKYDIIRMLMSEEIKFRITNLMRLRICFATWP